MFEDGQSDEVYDELRKIAAIHLRRTPARPTLQATELVHEAWFRLAGRDYRSRTQFLALASRTMRMLLIDSIRARMAAKRHGARQHLELTAEVEFNSLDSLSMPIERIIEVDRVLTELAARDPRKAQVVEMRFFGGLEFQEIAEVLEISLATAKRDWEFSKTWLFTRLSA